MKMGEDLQKLEELFKNGFILQEEYDSRKHQLGKGIPKKPAFGNPVLIPPPITPPVPTLSEAEIANEIRNFPILIQQMQSPNKNEQLESVTRIRKALSVERQPPIDQLIQAGGIPVLVQLLGTSYPPEIRYEAAWSLTNVASGNAEQSKVVLNSGALPIFVQMLGSPQDDLKEQAIWAFGNLAGDSPASRDVVIGMNVIPAIIDVLQSSSKITILRNGVWTLSNLCRSKPFPPLNILSPMLPLLAKMIYITDTEIICDACWALSYISDGDVDRIQAVVESGVTRRLVELLLHETLSIVTPALRTLGNIATGNDMQTQLLLNQSILPCLLSILNSPKKSIRKEACWTISNITAGNSAQIQSVIEAGLIPPLIQLMTAADFDIKKEALWAMSNALSGGSVQQVKYFVEQGCVPPLCDMLTNTQDARILITAISGLEQLCSAGAKVAHSENIPNPAVLLIEQCGGITHLEQLQHNVSQEVYEKATKLIELYWFEDDDSGAQSMDAGGGYIF